MNAAPFKTAEANELFELIASLVIERRQLRDRGNEAARQQYALEWDLEDADDFEQSIEQREESACAKIADAEGISFEQANAILIENL